MSTHARIVDLARGHLWTLAPVVRQRLRPVPQVPGRPFEASQRDPKLGQVRITGLLSALSPEAPLLVLIHGLGGSIDSPYMVRLARIAHEARLNTLQLNLRGADLSGDDIYHAGLTSDLDAALQHEDVAHYRRIVVLGCSMGGHMTLRYGLRPTDSRVVAIASCCAPLDLRQGVMDIDQPQRALYRRHVLQGLKRIYRTTYARGRAQTSLPEVEAATSIAQWDERAVAPRFGFESAEHYWHETQVAPLLRTLAVPTRITLTRHDPMVLMRHLVKHLDNLPRHVEVDCVDGGHLGFAKHSRVESMLIDWLANKARA